MKAATLLLKPQRGYIPQPRVSEAPPWVKTSPRFQPCKGCIRGRAGAPKGPWRSQGVVPVGRLDIKPLQGFGEGMACLPRVALRLPWAVVYNPFGVTENEPRIGFVLYK